MSDEVEDQSSTNEEDEKVDESSRRGGIAAKNEKETVEN